MLKNDEIKIMGSNVLIWCNAFETEAIIIVEWDSTK